MRTGASQGCYTTVMAKPVPTPQSKPPAPPPPESDPTWEIKTGGRPPR